MPTKTVNIPADLHKALKRAALEREMTVVALLAQAIRDLLAKDNPE